MLKPWKLISTQSLIKNRWLDLVEEELETQSGGKISPFYRFNTSDWGMVIARTIEGKFVLVNQYRRGTDQICTEFPAGGFDAGEDPAQGMARELQEETGYGSDEDIQLLANYPVNPANQNARVHIYFWDQVYLQNEPQNHPTEELETLVWSFEEVEAGFQRTQIQHPIHHLAWLLVQSHL